MAALWCWFFEHNCLDLFCSCPLSEHNVWRPTAFCGDNASMLARTLFPAASAAWEAFKPGDKRPTSQKEAAPARGCVGRLIYSQSSHSPLHLSQESKNQGPRRRKGYYIKLCFDGKK